MMVSIILLLNPVYVTFFWMLILHLYPFRLKGPKVFLGKFMLVAFILYLSHFFYFTRQSDIYLFLDPFYTSASLAVYPMYYIYVRLLTGEDTFSFRKHFRYLIIPVLFFIFEIAALLMLDNDSGRDYITRVLAGINEPEGKQVLPYSIYIAGRIVFILQVVIYMFLARGQLLRYRKLVADYYSETEGRSLKWVSAMNISYFIASLASMSLAYLGREMFLENELLLVFPSLVFSLLLFILGYLGSRQESALMQKTDPLDNIDDLNEDSRIRLGHALQVLFERDKIYLTPDLKISDVCNALGTNRTYVSNVINQKFKINFAGFVNSYRLEHAKNLIRENRKLRAEELADLSGFGSVNSLYRAFQDKGQSLADFRNKNI